MQRLASQSRVAQAEEEAKVRLEGGYELLRASLPSYLALTAALRPAIGASRLPVSRAQLDEVRDLERDTAPALEALHIHARAASWSTSSPPMRLGKEVSQARARLRKVLLRFRPATAFPKEASLETLLDLARNMASPGELTPSVAILPEGVFSAIQLTFLPLLVAMVAGFTTHQVLLFAGAAYGVDLLAGAGIGAMASSLRPARTALLLMIDLMATTALGLAAMQLSEGILTPLWLGSIVSARLLSALQRRIARRRTWTSFVAGEPSLVVWTGRWRPRQARELVVGSELEIVSLQDATGAIEVALEGEGGVAGGSARESVVSFLKGDAVAARTLAEELSAAFKLEIEDRLPEPLPRTRRQRQLP